jgi:hypothetical protein
MSKNLPKNHPSLADKEKRSKGVTNIFFCWMLSIFVDNNVFNFYQNINSEIKFIKLIVIFIGGLPFFQ